MSAALAASSMALPIGSTTSLTAPTIATSAVATSTYVTSATTDGNKADTTDYAADDADSEAEATDYPSDEDIQSALQDWNATISTNNQTSNGTIATDGVADKSIGSWFKKHGKTILKWVGYII